MSRRAIALALSTFALACNGGSCSSPSSSRATRPTSEPETPTATETAAPTATATATATATTEKRERLDAAPATSAERAVEASREDLVEPSGDACPTGYARGADATKCHRLCRRDTDCHAPNACMAFPGSRQKVCDVQR